MTLVLVVEQESRFAERIQDALTRDGFAVEVVDNKDLALQVVATQRPSLILVSIELDGAPLMLDSFVRRNGGPGVIALVPERRAADLPTFQARADSTLIKPFSEQDLRLAVRRSLAATAPAPNSDRKLTSQEIFGDLLAELRQESAPSPSEARAAQATEEIVNRKLEETLSGVIGVPRKPTAPAPPAPVAAPPSPPPKPPAPPAVAPSAPPAVAAPVAPPAPALPRRPAATASSDSEVEKLLSRTLGGLDLPRPRATAPPAAAPPAAPRPPAPTSPASVGPVSASPAARLADMAAAATVRMPAVSAASAQSQSAGSFSSTMPVPKAQEAPPPAAPAPPPRPAPPAASPSLPSPASPPPVRRPAERVSVSAEPGQHFGQYTLLEKIAVGGMAEVWKARMTGMEGFEKLVAIKKILPHLTDNAAFVTMLIDEAKLAAQLTHPNITHIYDLGRIGDDNYIAMEYVEGRNLRALLNQARRHGVPLPLGLALLIGARLASALDYAHRKKGFDGHELGLVHRDVSPQNVLISNEGDIKLCDFGIVKAVSKASHTQMGALKGKLQYMSPEQAWGRPVDGRSDLFSLGAILFEMLTGRRLFPGDNEMAVLEAVRECRIDSPRDLDPAIPEEVDAIVLKALAKDPAERFQTAGALQQALERLLYSLRPTPTQNELAGLMYRLFEPGVSDDEPTFSDVGSAPRLYRPQPVTPPLGAPSPPEPVAPAAARPAPAPPRLREVTPPPMPPIVRPPARPEMPAAAPPAPVAPTPVPGLSPAANVRVELEEGSGSKRTGLLVGIAVLVLLAIAAWYFFGRAKPAAPDAGTDAPTTTAPADDTTPIEPPPTTSGEAETGATAPPGADGTAAPADGHIDVEKLVDQELAKREEDLRRKLDSEQKRLEQQLANAKAAEDERKRQSPGRPTEPATTPREAVTAPAVPPETAPSPLVPAASPAPEPARQAEPEPSPPESPAPPPSRSEAPVEMPQVKVGQLVTPGPGVIMPSLVSITKPEYPALARRLRVEGTVELEVLVDENGAVRDARITQGARQEAGLNESALRAARSAKYRPATKDGVRVKVWTRLKVPFKLES